MKIKKADINNRAIVPKLNDQPKSWVEKFFRHAKEFFHSVMLIYEYVVILLLAYIVMKSLILGYIFPDADFSVRKDVLCAIVFMRENWIGVILATIIVFARVIMTKFAQIKKAGSLETENIPTQWRL